MEITRIDGLDTVEDEPGTLIELTKENENNEASNFTPLVIKIIYSLNNPQYGLYFVLPDDMAATNVIQNLIILFRDYHIYTLITELGVLVHGFLVWIRIMSSVLGN